MKIPLHARLLKKRKGNGQHFHALNIDVDTAGGERGTWLPSHDSVPEDSKEQGRGGCSVQTHFPSTEVPRKRKKANAGPRNLTTDTAQHPPTGLIVGKVTTRMTYTPSGLSASASHQGSKENIPAAVCATSFLCNAVLLRVPVIV